VGTNGSSLSGGQKQRICICRAIYQNCDIYLFDDILSSLDVHVAEAISKKLIKDFLKEKTILFASSHYSLISTADNILYVKDGKIIDDPSEMLGFFTLELKRKNSSMKKSTHSDREEMIVMEKKQSVIKK
jgi:ABC-type multidrug transport system fused ATPase/permease subunit